MFIQYSIDGNYETFSNSKRKSLDVFLRERHLFQTKSNIKSLNSIKINNEIDILFDVDSFLSYINLDCISCAKLNQDMICDYLYPLEMILDVDEHFVVDKIIVYINCEETRLISYYGKHGHLRHCVDSDLLNNPYYKKADNDKCDKRKQFRLSDYEYAYIVLSKQIIDMFGVDIYKQFNRYMVSMTRKTNTLFNVKGVK